MFYLLLPFLPCLKQISFSPLTIVFKLSLLLQMYQLTLFMLLSNFPKWDSKQRTINKGLPHAKSYNAQFPAPLLKYGIEREFCVSFAPKHNIYLFCWYGRKVTLLHNNHDPIVPNHAPLLCKQYLIFNVELHSYNLFLSPGTFGGVASCSRNVIE